MQGTVWVVIPQDGSKCTMANHRYLISLEREKRTIAKVFRYPLLCKLSVGPFFCRRKKTIPRLVQSFLLTERLQPNPLYDSRSNVTTPCDGRSPRHVPVVTSSAEVTTSPQRRGRLHVGWSPQQSASDHAVYESVTAAAAATSSSANALDDRTYYNLVGRSLLAPDSRGRSQSVCSSGVDLQNHPLNNAGSGPL